MSQTLKSRLMLPLGGSLVAVSVLLAACGGGGSSPSEQATSYTEGQITGYGSIVVNGVRFDDSSASVSDDDDVSGRRGDLKIGMWVEIEGTDVDRDRGVGRALRVRWANEFVGPVTAVDATAGTFVVFGQTVEVKPATQYEDLPNGLASLREGDVVEVHGFFNAAAGRYVATRVDAEDSADFYKLRGIVSDLDTAAETFKLGSETINYADVTDVPSNLANGLRVRVRLRTMKDTTSGYWVAVTMRHGIRNLIDRLESEIEGVVDTCASNTSFSVNGIPVDASTAFFRDGPVTCGDQVEVKGQVDNGVLKAALVKDEDDDGDDRNEMHGTVVSADPAKKTFVLNHPVHGDVTVSYAFALFDDGTAADLTTGARVEVKGRLVLGGVLQAVKVDFED